MNEQQQETQPLDSDNGGTGGVNLNNTPANAGGVHIEAESQPDLSAFFKEGEVGVFDAEKVAELARNLETQKKSTSYFQSQYMKKNGVPETPEGYEKNFKADSIYEAALKDEKAQAGVKEFFKWAHENKIGEREAAVFLDYQLKAAVKSNAVDLRSEEQKAADEETAHAEALKMVEPMLDNLGRSYEENTAIIENFLNSPSIFTNNPDMKSFIREVAEYSPMGYMFVTLLTQAIEHKGIPVITGTAMGSKDKAAFDKEFNAESDPIKRENMLKSFLGEA